MVEELEDDLTCATKELGCTTTDFEHHLAAEQAYVASLDKPDPVVEMKKDYIKALGQTVIYQYDFVLVI